MYSTSICMSSCLSVCVRGSVLDVNDETPTFNPRLYNVSLKESVPRDHIVARLSCSDNDAGLNAELSYFITGQRSKWGLFLCVCGLQGSMCTYSTFVHPSICVWPVCDWGELLLHASFSIIVVLCVYKWVCLTNKLIWNCVCVLFLGGNQDGKFSVGFRDGVVRTVVGLDRETQAAYTLVVEAIGMLWTHLFMIIEKRYHLLSSPLHSLCVYLL